MNKNITEHLVLLKEYSKIKGFTNQINFIKKNQNKIVLGNDYNWFNVKILDEEVADYFEEKDLSFGLVENEWGWREMVELLLMLDFKVVDA